MKNAQCKKCMKNFQEKEIFTIQQFQYRKEPPYKWSVEYFQKLDIDEWTSFCENCLKDYAQESVQAWKDTES